MSKYEVGQLITIDCARFVYDGVAYSRFKGVNLHKLCEIGVDDYGKVFATDNVWYFTDEELAMANELSPTHWQSLVERIIRIKYPNLTAMQTNGAVMDIVDRCFAHDIPKMHELNAYIDAYMNA